VATGLTLWSGVRFEELVIRHYGLTIRPKLPEWERGILQ